MTASFAAGPAPSFRLDAAGPVTAIVTGAADGLEETVAAIEGLGRRALALPADVADADAMAEAVRRTEAELGPLPHAVNGAW